MDVDNLEKFNPLALFDKEANAQMRKALDSLGGNELYLPPLKLHQHSDYAFVCFSLAGPLGMKPQELAEKLVAGIGANPLFEKIENVGPYVNFYIDRKVLAGKTMEMVFRMKDRYGSFEFEDQAPKIILEHTSANPTGPLHVGRARNPIIGDTMARILRKRGYDLDVHFYVDDMGKQLVILTWGHENITGLDVESDRADHKFVKFYQEANRLMAEDPNINNEINKLISLYEEDGEADISKKVKKNCEDILEGMLVPMMRLDIHYDKFDLESKYVRDGSVAEVVEKLRASESTGEDDGALYLDLEKFGIHGRENKLFLTRSDGTSLYTTRDIAYHIDKHNNFDHMINVLGEDHKLKAEAVSIALNEVLDYEKKVEVIFYAFVSLPEGKMSTRKGQVVYMDDLIEEAVSRALAEVEKKRPELPEEIKLGIAETVGVGAIRYNIIRVQAEKQMTFKWEEAMNFEGNSAPFIQYSHARASSILRNTDAPNDFDPGLLIHESEISLIKALARFPSLIIKCADDRTPHLVASYTYELASLFNQFYRDCPVLSAEADIMEARLNLVKCSKMVLQNALNTLGIVAPEEM